MFHVMFFFVSQNQQGFFHAKWVTSLCLFGVMKGKKAKNQSMKSLDFHETYCTITSY